MVTGPPKNTPRAVARAEKKKQEASAIAAVLDSVQIEKDIPLLAGLFAFQDGRESGTEIMRKITRNYAKHNNADINIEISVEYSSVEALPTADDRQMYMAFIKVANESRTSHGKLQNPIVFSATSILKVLGKSESDENYEAVDKWISQMVHTHIKYSVVITYRGNKQKREYGSCFSTFRNVHQESTFAGSSSPRSDEYSIDVADWIVNNINQHID